MGKESLIIFFSHSSLEFSYTLEEGVVGRHEGQQLSDWTNWNQNHSGVGPEFHQSQFLCVGLCEGQNQAVVTLL